MSWVEEVMREWGGWLRAFGKYLPQLFARDLVKVSVSPSMVICVGNGPAYSLVEERAAKRKKPKRGSQCVAGSKTFPRRGLV